jgi:hypothetical protein
MNVAHLYRLPGPCPVDPEAGAVAKQAAKLHAAWVDAVTAARATSPDDKGHSAAWAATDKPRRAFEEHVNANFDDLLAILDGEGDTAQEAIVQQIEALRDAFAFREDVKRRLEALCRNAEHLDPQDVVTGVKHRGAAVHPHAILDTTGDALDKLAEQGADMALPIPHVAEAALKWRRDQIAGVEPEPSTLTNL